MRLYLRFIRAYLKSLAEYRFLFIMDMFLQIVTYALELAGIWILLNKFNNLILFESKRTHDGRTVTLKLVNSPA